MSNNEIIKRESKQLSTEQQQVVSEKVESLTTDLTALTPHTPEYKARANELANIGESDIYKTTAAADRLLNRTVRSMRDIDSGNTKVSKSLIDLRTQVEKVDPNRARSLNGIMSRLPIIGGSVRSLSRYMREFEPAKEQIDAIVKGLYAGKEELTRDNAAIEVEMAAMWEAGENMAQNIIIAAEVADKIEKQVEELRETDPEAADRMANDMLFPARQRQNDLMLHQSVTAQNYAALEVIHRNNEELKKGVVRATGTTVAALNAAVMINSALATQEQNIKNINAVNEVTSQMILSNSERMKKQTGEIAQQAMTSGIDPERLKKAFANIIEAVNDIEDAKRTGLVSMEQEIGKLETEMQRLGQSHIAIAQLQAGESDAEDEVTPEADHAAPYSSVAPKPTTGDDSEVVDVDGVIVEDSEGVEA